jgi:hypothetical protein
MLGSSQSARGLHVGYLDIMAVSFEMLMYLKNSTYLLTTINNNYKIDVNIYNGTTFNGESIQIV